MKFDTPLALFQHLLSIDENNMEANLPNFINEKHEFYADVTALITAHEENKKQTSFNELIGKQAEQLVEDNAIHELLNTQVGVYKLTKKLGQGGMGAVYLGERNDGQLEQKVAIKFVYPSIVALAGEGFLQKEAQHLANLDHTNIAKIFTVGYTNENIPYMLMEYVDGTPIDQYCEESNLELDARLSLFKKVCDAVQTAHKNMVIHADIKPSNILVDKQGEPKLMDFGIAKRISQNEVSAQKNISAASHNYASPEQVNNENLTTASDIFALGQNLKYLSEDIKLKPLKRNEVQSVIKQCLHQEPDSRPSLTKLMTYLDDIKKDRSLETYSSSLFYTTRKLISRYKALSFSTMTAVILLIAFMFNLVNSNIELEKQSEIAEESLEFLEGSLLQLQAGDINHKTVKELVQSRADEIENVESADVQAKLNYIFGRIAHNIDEFDISMTLAQKAIDFFGKNQKYYSQLRAMTSQAEAIRKKGDVNKAIAIYKEALEIAITHDINTSIPTINNNLGGIYFSLNDYENAYIHFLETISNIDKLERRLDHYGSEAMMYQNFASAAGQLNKYDEAEKYFKLAQQTLNKSSDKNLGQKAELNSQLGFFYLHQEQYDLASEYLTSSLRSTIDLYGKDHLNVAYKSFNLAKTYQGLKQYTKAQPFIEQAEKIFLTKFGEQDYRLAIVRNGLADCLYFQGQNEEALSIIEKTIPVLTGFFGADHTRTTDALESKADIEKAIAKSDSEV